MRAVEALSELDHVRMTRRHLPSEFLNGKQRYAPSQGVRHEHLAGIAQW